MPSAPGAYRRSAAAALIAAVWLAFIMVCQLAGCRQEPETAACDDPLGCLDLAPDESIHIAALQALSGETRRFGVDQIRGIELALEERGHRLLGHRVVLNRLNSRCSHEGGKVAAQKAVSNPKTAAVLGTSCSVAAVPAAEIVSRAGLIMISSSNTAPSLTAVRGQPGSNSVPGYFRVAHNDIHQGEAAAVFARQALRLDRAATIHDGDPYTRELARAFRDVFAKEGGSIVFDGGINKGDTDMKPVLRAVLESRAEILFFPLFQPEGDYLVRQAGSMAGMDRVVLMGAEGLLVDSFLDAVGEAGQGMYFIGPAKLSGPAYQAFVRRYRERFKQDPQSPYHAHAYDAACMVFECIARTAVRREDGGLLIGRQSLRDEIAALKGYQGVTGVLDCNDSGDCGASKFNAVRLSDSAEGLAALRGNVVFTSWTDE